MVRPQDLKPSVRTAAFGQTTMIIFTATFLLMLKLHIIQPVKHSKSFIETPV